jgi:hypothetical protein
MRLNFSILTFNLVHSENIIILSNTLLREYMTLTFFCKRGRHGQCPGKWPMDDRGGDDHDCSFDIKMTKCICDCHSNKS